jgi:hypothetical protein
MCSHGGDGFVTDVIGDGVLRMFTVKYNESGSSGGKTELDIPYSHLTVVPSPFASTKLARERRAPEMLDNRPPEPPMTPTLMKIQDILAAGAARGKHKGWRAKELGVVEHGCRNERFNILLREDTKELLGFVSGQSTAGTGVSTRHNKKGRNGRFLKRAIKHNPHTVLYLAKAWGVGKNFPLLNLKKGAATLTTKPDKPASPTQRNAIDDLEAAKFHFSAKCLFINNCICELNHQEVVYAYESNTGREQIHEFRELAKADWVLAEPKVVDFWEAQSRSKIARQPQICDNIIEAMRANPSKSFEKIAEDIGNWCTSRRKLRSWLDPVAHMKATFLFTLMQLSTPLPKTFVIQKDGNGSRRRRRCRT